MHIPCTPKHALYLLRCDLLPRTYTSEVNANKRWKAWEAHVARLEQMGDKDMRFDFLSFETFQYNLTQVHKMLVKQ